MLTSVPWYSAYENKRRQIRLSWCWLTLLCFGVKPVEGSSRLPRMDFDGTSSSLFPSLPGEEGDDVHSLSSWTERRRISRARLETTLTDESDDIEEKINPFASTRPSSSWTDNDDDVDDVDFVHGLDPITFGGGGTDNLFGGIIGNSQKKQRMISSVSNYRKKSNSLALHLQGMTHRNQNDDDDIDFYDGNDKNPLPDSIKKRLTKTGTTIAGCCIRDHVILAADTRATEGTMVADKRCQKLHQLSSNCWCCGAGTSADLDHLTKLCLYSIALQNLQEGTIGNTIGLQQRQENPENNSTNIHPKMESLQLDQRDDQLLLVGAVPIEEICMFLQDELFEGNGQIGANIILGGVWEGCAQLVAIHPHGSMDVDLPFAALGSGGLAAMGVMEDGYNNTMSVEEGIDLVQRAILAGIQNDLGSGSQVDLCIVYPDGSSKMQRCVVPEEHLDIDDAELFEPKNQKKTEAAQGGDKVGIDSMTNNNFGVNGFGNQPFGIKSERMILQNIDYAEREKLSKWNAALGLNNDDE